MSFKNLFLKVLIHGHDYLTPPLLYEAEHHGRKEVMEHVAHAMGRQEERKIIVMGSGGAHSSRHRRQGYRRNIMVGSNGARESCHGRQEEGKIQEETRLNITSFNTLL